MGKLLISHIDLDGLGIVALANHFNPILKFDSIICRNYDFELEDGFIEEMSNYDEIIIADLSINPKSTQQLRDLGIKITFFDHHETAEWVAEDGVSVFDTTRSGTKLFWEEYVKPQIKRYPPVVDHFVELVNTYDMWLEDSPLWLEAKGLNYLLFGVKNYYEEDVLKSSQRFLDSMERKFQFLSEWDLTEGEKVVVANAFIKEDDVFEKAMEDMQIRVDSRGLLFGTFAIGSKISAVCSRVLKDQHNLDYVVALNSYKGINGNISFRSRNGFNLNSLYAAKGHAAAAGGTVSPDDAVEFLNNPEYAFIYNEDFDEKDPVVFKVVDISETGVNLE